MKTAEAIQVHEALHNPAIQYVRTSYDGIADELFAHPIRTARSITQDFRSVTVGPYLVITQNLRKPGPNTDWVRADFDHRKLTWILVGDQYVGKIQDFVDDEGHFVREVHALRPDRVVYRFVEGEQLVAS